MLAGEAPLGGGLAARAEALQLLDRVLRRGENLDEAFSASTAAGPLAQIPQADRNLCYAIVATTLRRHGEINAEIGRHLAKALPRSSGRARSILMIAAAQLLFMRLAPHAAVDTAVSLARFDPKARHFAGLINAVCRKIAAGAAAYPHLPPEPFVNSPPWLAGRWRRTYGDAEAAAIVMSHVAEPPLDITAPRETLAWSEKLGGTVFHDCTVRLDHNRMPVSALPGYADGQWWVQDAASALPAHLLGDIRDARVLDLCAAPGGKTAQLAAAGAAVTAVDRSAARLRRLEHNLARLKLTATAILADVMDYVPDSPFDAILLDAPCSGTGIIRRHPDLPFRRTPAEISELSSLQQRLLERAASFAKPQGCVVFSTCSLEPEEGEQHLLQLPETLTLVPLVQTGSALKPEWIDAHGCLRTRPSQGLDGFFAMRLARL